MSSSTNQAPVPVIGVKREGEETLVINPERQPEEPEIMEIGSDSDRNDEEPELWEIGPLPNLGDSVHGHPIVNNTREAFLDHKSTCLCYSYTLTFH
jgi:hypothetical protein